MTRANVLQDPPGSDLPPGGPWRRRGLWIALLAAVLAALITVGVLVAQRPSPSPSPTGSRSGAPSGHPTAAATPTSSYAVDCVAVGAAVNPEDRRDGNVSSIFRRVDEQLGRLTIRRSFDRSLPASFAGSSAAGDAAAGLHSFVSWKPPGGDYRGTIAGKYDGQIAAWARSVPRTGVFATAFHEPENNMSAADFVAFQRHVYPIVKKANPTIHWGPVYMAYKWDPTHRSSYIGDPQAWWPGADYADFAGLDWYGRDPLPMTTSPSFTTWFTALAPKGRPLLITEYGQYWQPAGQPLDPQKLAARAAAIRQDATWIFAHPQIKAWLYWQSGDATGSWRLDDPASRAAWKSVAARGCQS